MKRTFTVTGMSCAACSARVEKAVRGVPGVEDCAVSLLTNEMSVEGPADDAAVGTAVSDGTSIRYDFNPRLARSSHGTGDVFASVFAGAILRGLDGLAAAALAAAALAADIVCAAIEATSPDHWYGVAFERTIPLLATRLDAAP